MKYSDAEKIAEKGLSDAFIFLNIACDSDAGTPLYKEMRSAILESLSWADDDEVIDAMYDADMRENGHYDYKSRQ